ncbi:MAG: cellulase family glycosylhydrolase [bacterium]
MKFPSFGKLFCYLLILSIAYPKEGSLIYGVNVVWGISGSSWGADFRFRVPTLISYMKAGGVTCTRLGISWADVERVKGERDWAYTDRFVELLFKNGFEIICCFCTTPEWASGLSKEEKELFHKRGLSNLIGVVAPREEYYDILEDFAEETARRYKGKIKYYEFWNEPDGMGMPFIEKDEKGKPIDIRFGGDPRVYTELLKRVYKGLKRGNPNCVVSVGGLESKTSFLKGIYDNGGKEYFDAVAIHPYSEEGIRTNWIDEIRELMVKMGDEGKPIWITEWGWATQDWERQAKLLRKGFAEIMKRPYIKVATFHTLNDWRGNEADPNSLIPMGLLTYDLRPKPAYWEFKRTAHGWQEAL